MYKKNIFNILKMYREGKALSQKEIAQKINVSDSYYSRIEKGVKQSLKPEKLFILKKELGISDRDFKKLILFLNAPTDERLQKIFYEIAEEI